jgi:diphthine synthase
MFYLIGLGLNEKSITLEAKEALEKCKKIYLENYTVDFPYSFYDLEKNLGKKIISLNRGEVENDKLIKEAKKEDVCLLVYGSPLFATTHMSLIEEAKKNKVKTKIFYNASVFEAIASTGLQPYKFGKTTSMPKWQKNFTPESFIDVVRENNSIKAHSIILCDIGLGFQDALNQLETSAKNKQFVLSKIVVCSLLGTNNEKIIYNTLDNLRKLGEIKNPFCLIIPGDLHFMEKESLEAL